MNSWINEHSDDDVSMSDESEDVDDIILSGLESDDEIPEEIVQLDEDVNNDDAERGEEVEEEEEEGEEEEDEEEDEEDEVVAAFISARSEKNRNHPPNLSVGNVLIGGFAFHPDADVIALGLSNGDIAM